MIKLKKKLENKFEFVKKVSIRYLHICNGAKPFLDKELDENLLELTIREIKGGISYLKTE